MVGVAGRGMMISPDTQLAVHQVVVREKGEIDIRYSGGHTSAMKLLTRLTLIIAAAAMLCCAPCASPAADGIDSKVDSALRKELLNKIAVELEAQYVIPETAKKLAALVRAKQKANAYKSITSPMGSCAGTDR